MQKKTINGLAKWISITAVILSIFSILWIQTDIDVNGDSIFANASQSVLIYFISLAVISTLLILLLCSVSRSNPVFIVLTVAAIILTLTGYNFSFLITATITITLVLVAIRKINPFAITIVSLIAFLLNLCYFFYAVVFTDYYYDFRRAYAAIYLLPSLLIPVSFMVYSIYEKLYKKQ